MLEIRMTVRKGDLTMPLSFSGDGEAEELIEAAARACKWGLERYGLLEEANIIRHVPEPL